MIREHNIDSNLQINTKSNNSNVTDNFAGTGEAYQVQPPLIMGEPKLRIIVPSYTEMHSPEFGNTGNTTDKKEQLSLQTLPNQPIDSHIKVLFQNQKEIEEAIQMFKDDEQKTEEENQNEEMASLMDQFQIDRRW